MTAGIAPVMPLKVVVNSYQRDARPAGHHGEERAHRRSGGPHLRRQPVVPHVTACDLVHKACCSGSARGVWDFGVRVALEGPSAGEAASGWLHRGWIEESSKLGGFTVTGMLISWFGGACWSDWL